MIFALRWGRIGCRRMRTDAFPHSSSMGIVEKWKLSPLPVPNVTVPDTAPVKLPKLAGRSPELDLLFDLG